MLAQLLRRLVGMMTDSNFIQINKAAKLIRNDILYMSTQFRDLFHLTAKKPQFLSLFLHCLVNVLLHGTKLTSQLALSLSQLIMVDCIKRSKENTKFLYHSYSSTDAFH